MIETASLDIRFCHLCPGAQPDFNRNTLLLKTYSEYGEIWEICLPFIRSGQNHLARHSENGQKTRQTEEEVGRQHQGMDRPGLRQVQARNGEQRKMEETGCEVICSAPTTLAVRG